MCKSRALPARRLRLAPGPGTLCGNSGWPTCVASESVDRLSTVVRRSFPQACGCHDARMADDQGTDGEAFIEVIGTGAADVASNHLRLHLAAESSAASVADAFDAAEAALTRMLAALREHGATDEDLRSTEIDIHPDHDKGGNRSGFRASMGVSVVLRDLASAGTVLAATIEAGGDASRVHGLSLAATATPETLASARDAAWADAVVRANHYAALAGRNLGAVLSVSEIGQSDGLAPKASRAALSGAHLEPGSQTIRASVAARWQLV
jgi:uncharacterized protein YggE